MFVTREWLGIRKTCMGFKEMKWNLSPTTETKWRLHSWAAFSVFVFLPGAAELVIPTKHANLVKAALCVWGHQQALLSQGCDNHWESTQLHRQMYGACGTGGGSRFLAQLTGKPGLVMREQLERTCGCWAGTRQGSAVELSKMLVFCPCNLHARFSMEDFVWSSVKSEVPRSVFTLRNLVL